MALHGERQTNGVFSVTESGDLERYPGQPNQSGVAFDSGLIFLSFTGPQHRGRRGNMSLGCLLFFSISAQWYEGSGHAFLESTYVFWRLARW